MAIMYRNGGAGNDLIDSSLAIGPIQIQGRGGDDTITGGIFNDKLYGEDGNDVIAGGLGADSLRGGAGADIFVISRADMGMGDDHILDFEGAGNGSVSGDDVIHFTGFSTNATLTFVRQSGDDHIYLIRDGSAASLVKIAYSGAARLVAGDYLFLGAVAPGSNQAPVAGADTATVLASGPRTLTLAATALLANDSDGDGDALHITEVGTAAHGTLTLNTNGTPVNFADDFITYTPAAGYAGSDTFNYTVSDGTASVTGMVTVTVQAQTIPTALTYRNGGNGNDLIDTSLAAGPQYIQGRAGNDTVIGGGSDDKLYGNDGDDILNGGGGADSLSGGAGADTYVIAKSDLSGRAESIMDFDGAGNGGAGGDVIRLLGFGAGATLTFVRQAGKDHVYQINDGGFVAQLKIAYTGTTALVAGDYVFTGVTPPANQPPIAGPVAVSTRTNAIVSGKLPATDGDGDAVTFSLVTGPAHGTLKLGGDGGYIYAPGAGYSGADAFTVRLNDGYGGVTQALVSIDVQASAADPAPWRDTSAATQLVFVQRDGTSGSFYVAADMARVTKGGAVVADWTDKGVILGVPQGDGYLLETITGGVTTTRPLAVGEVIAAAGQSNMEGWFTAPGYSHAPQASIYQWAPPTDDTAGHWTSATGAGAIAFAETLRLAEPDLPIGFVTGAVGGTKLLEASNVRYWMATGAGTLYQDLLDQVAAASHGQTGVLLWNQGEADSATRVDPAAYADGLRTLFSRFDRDIAPERIVISGLAFTRGNADALRLAQASVATADGHIIYVPTTPTIETWDDTHLTVTARIFQATEDAMALLAAKGISVPGLTRAWGTMAADVLTGNALIDILQGGGGNDSLSGADGNDIIRGEAGADRVQGDAGNDALSGGIDNDTVDGGAGNDDVFGDAGHDVLTGGDGADLLDGGGGADTLSGQAGDDSYIVDNIGDVVSEVDGEGVDTVYARLNYTLTAYVENLILDGKEPIGGTGNDLANTMTGNDTANFLSGLGGRDSLLGGSGNDTLDGGDGDDFLMGGSGTDSLIGGEGDDTYYVESGDVVSETSTGGSDTVVSQVSYILPYYVEAVVLGGRSPISATGTDENNSLTGNVNGNLLDGAGGNDTLAGLSGNDSLRGGQGNDWLLGGDSADRLVGGVGADTLSGDASKRAQDTFVFETLADSGLGAGNRDIVTDFDSQDIFDVSLIDANTAVAGDQSFQFVGTAAFSAAGQIRYSVVAGGMLIELNVDSDLGADAEILLLNPLATPGVTDFQL
jgi:Ca2+-binding RTX toxin-like protein